MKNIKKIAKLKVVASSILEVTTSMVLIGIIFGLATTIYFNLTSSSTSQRKLKYTQELQHLAIKTVNEKSYINERLEIDGVTIVKSIELFESNPMLLRLHFEAIIPGGKTLTTYDELIYDAVQ